MVVVVEMMQRIEGMATITIHWGYWLIYFELGILMTY